MTADLADAPVADPHQTATRVHLSDLKGDALVAWRMADVPDRPTADARNLQSEFPMGWFAVCYSDELAPGQLKAARYFATDLAIWRGEDGQARVIDAYCAHYGANMAVGGKVHGNLLECPFHAWRWEGDGSCRDIPYSRAIPPQARRKDCVPSWPVAEMNGMIHVWYHPEKAAPLWDPVVFESVGLPGWTPFRKYQWHVFTALENMADNAVDVSHFKYVHGAKTVPEYEFAFDAGVRPVFRTDRDDAGHRHRAGRPAEPRPPPPPARRCCGRLRLHSRSPLDHEHAVEIARLAGQREAVEIRLLGQDRRPHRRIGHARRPPGRRQIGHVAGGALHLVGAPHDRLRAGAAPGLETRAVARNAYKGRAGEASDVAAMGALPMADEGAVITGQVISVDGGSSMRP